MSLSPNIRQASGEQMRVGNRRRHQLRRFIAGVPEHHPLVSRALLLLGLGVDSPGDVLRLPLDRHHHAAGIAVKPHRAVGVANPADRPADDLRNLHVTRGGYFAGHDRQACLDQGFHRHPPMRILGDDCIENAVADLIGHFIGMTFGHRFGRKKEVFGHWYFRWKEFWPHYGRRRGAVKHAAHSSI